MVRKSLATPSSESEPMQAGLETTESRAFKLVI